MFARKVCVGLKPGALRMFSHLMEFEVLPWLRTQEGFLDLITLAGQEGLELQVLSFWQNQGHAEACNGAYPAGVTRILEALLDSIPNGRTFEVVTSTVERLAPPRTSESGHSADGEEQPYSGDGFCEKSA